MQFNSFEKFLPFQIPLVIKLLDVNDNTPTFQKNLYEFILTTDFRNFTIPAFMKAIDNDAEPPNNIVRYEIIHGNYQNKFALNEISGQLTLRESLARINNRNKRQVKNQDMDIFVLTVRAFDLGVPVRYSTTTVRIYPPESRARAISFLVPGFNPDRQKLVETLSEMTGGRVVIQDIRPDVPDIAEKMSESINLDVDNAINAQQTKNVGDTSGAPPREERSIVTATVIYDGDSVVDVLKIQEKLLYGSEGKKLVPEKNVVRSKKICNK